MRMRFGRTMVAAWVALGAPAAAAQTLAASQDFANMSLEELANIEITSVSRRAERLSEAAASVFVITSEDIRRSGAVTLPQALRLAPNLFVAQAHASGQAINARGLAGTAANKLLVLIDGRSVYTPLFAGVFWDAQEVLLEDVERIEVISGPGGTLWGTNAVNGVINIITRDAGDTQGTLAAATAGEDGFHAALRQGGALGTGHWRAYLRHVDRDNTFTADRTAKDDAWRRTQVGFRADWARAHDRFTLQADAYDGDIGQPLPGLISVTGVPLELDTVPISGANVLGRWARELPGGGGISLQAYLDHTERTVPPTFAEKLDIADLQFQHALPLGAHRFTWGAQWRHSRDRLTNSAIIAFLPARLEQDWVSVYAQGDVALRDDLRLTLGARAERNDYTGTEFLPNARLAWSISPEHLLWAAATRTVRAPSRLDRDTFIPGAPPFLLAGGPEVRSEVAQVYELGYRGQPASRLSYSATAFVADYDHLRTQEIDASGTFLVFGSGMQGRTTGVEMWATFHAGPAWRLSAGYTALREELELEPGSNDLSAPARQEGTDPAHTWSLASSLDFARDAELDVHVRHVAALGAMAVPAYTAVDARLSWRPRRDLEVWLTGRNLFDDAHAEFTDPVTRTALERQFFLGVAWRP